MVRLMCMWFVLATLASMFWGIFYISSEHLYKHISVYTAIAIESLFLFIVTAYLASRHGALKEDLVTLGTSGKLMFLITAAVLATIVAEVSINFSISEKDATLAGFVEITYPFFIALFAYLLFGQEELSVGTAVGGVVVFIGACIIFYFGR
jgi:drug/metabolite transporter (DMT)-like permease